MKKRLLWLVAIPLIAIGSLTYANDFIVPDTENGTITVYSQDKSYWITIQDKNLWAENVWDYGYYYQWWNNHGNPAWTNAWTLNELLDANVNERVNKWYSGENDKFIIFNNWNKNTYDYRSGVYYTNATDNSYVWDSAYNNLWWGWNDNQTGDATIVKWYDTVNHVVTNPENRQWPCPDWYHVPSAWEWQELMMLRCNANPDCSWSVINTQNGEYARANYLNKSGIWTAFSNDLQLPLAGYRSYIVGAVYDQGSNAYYWSSSPRGGSRPEGAWYLNFFSNRVSPSYSSIRANGQSLRCFKDSYVKLPKTLNLFFMSDDEEVWTWEVTENMTGAIPEEAKNVTKTGYILEYRYLSGADMTTGFDFENTPISWAWADESGNVYFIAQWTGIKYEIKFESWDWTWTMENQTFTYDITWTLNRNAFTKTWYEFSGWIYWTTWYTDKQNVSNLTTTDGETVTLTAQWTPITYTISFSWNAADATWTAPDTINAEYDSGDIAPDNSFTLTGYTFTWWNTESNGSGTLYATWAELKNLTTTSGKDVKLYAQWEVNIHKLSFVVDWATIQSGNIAYWTTISAPANPTKDSCNSFAWWTSSVAWLTTTGTMPDSDVTFTANWNYTCSRSSGWWGGSSRSNKTSDTQDSSTSSQNDKNTENVIQSDPEHSEWGSEESSDTPIDSSANASEWQNYSQEFQQAYEFAHEKWITTMPTIQEAQMDGKLTRIAMAKMLSYYAMNVLWQKPANIVTPKFNDVTDKQNSDYDDWVTLAYQLWIMWQNMPNNKFRPNDEVTRAEFATALSRMLYHTSDWEYKSTDKYYTNHMKKLVQEKIITNDDAKMKELRWYVMIMLMRSAK